MAVWWPTNTFRVVPGGATTTPPSIERLWFMRDFPYLARWMAE